MTRDPYVVLGVPADADLVELRAARRRLAREAHPDHGGDEARMREINSAFDQAVKAILRPSPPRAPVAPTRSTPSEPPPVIRRAMRIEHDAPSFTVDALPVETFEALLIVTSWFGEVLVDDPPYLLEVHCYEPVCWCRLELVPEAGGTTVSLTVVEPEGTDVSLAQVRDLWIDSLNRLGRA